MGEHEQASGSSGVPTDARGADESPQMPECRLSFRERVVVSCLSSAQGALFVWAAWALPWTVRTPFSAIALVAGASHLACAIACVALPRRATAAWRISAFCSLGLLALSVWIVATSGAYLVRTYSSLGAGLTGAFLAALGLVALFTLPTSCWALVRTRGCPPHPVRTMRRALGLGALGVVALVAAAAHTASAAKPELVAERLAREEIDALRDAFEPRAHEARPRPLSPGAVAKCKSSPVSEMTAVLHYRSRGSKKTRAKCIQGTDRREVLAALSKRVGRLKSAWDVKLDWVTRTARVDAAPQVLSAIALRPGLDGVCLERRCFMPWQLLARGEFLRHRPLPFVRDLRFGASSERLAGALGGHASDTDELIRVETQSLVLRRDGEWEELRRMRPVHVDVDRQSVSAAIDDAERYVRRAQGDDGVFAYTVDPFSGQPTSDESFNLARQAGTTLALCDLAERTKTANARKELRQSIERSLDLLRDKEVSGDDPTIAALSLDADSSVVRMGANALPLVAFVRCRSLVGPKYDSTISRLTRFVLAAQLPDGNFPPHYRLRSSSSKKRAGPLPGTQPLYAGGQAILALLLVEAAQLRADGALPRIADAPQDAVVRSAVDRAMTYVTDEHWDHALRPFFFIEENWHCIAARAALGVHENEAYERYCYDYMRFKARLILDASSDVDPEFVGGFGFGNIIPPHNTGAAGLAEALAATIVVKQARAVSAEADRELLVEVMRFLMRQQWTERNGFACAPTALGSMSEHTHSPEVRIDFVQHLLSGLVHGGAVSGVVESDAWASTSAEPFGR